MHVAVYLYMLHHRIAVGFKATVEVMQVFMPLTFLAVALNNLVGSVFDKGS